MLLDDARMIHETTPIQPAEPGGVRDTLVLTYRRGNFQGPSSRSSRARPLELDWAGRLCSKNLSKTVTCSMHQSDALDTA
jgi:hypothetical protein